MLHGYVIYIVDNYNVWYISVFDSVELRQMMEGRVGGVYTYLLRNDNAQRQQANTHIHVDLQLVLVVENIMSCAKAISKR